MILKRIQLGLIHVAVAMTLVPINSTLNRVMIRELGLSATLVAILASLPYLFSPIQVAIGSFTDRHSIFGYRRTPAILLGLALCVVGVAISPWAAFELANGTLEGILLGFLPFLLWGLGFNLSSVCYLSLATELSDQKQRGGTIAVMWFMMIVSIILTAITLGNLVDPYTPEKMQRAFLIIASVAMGLGILALIGLEPRLKSGELLPESENHTPRQMWHAIQSNPVARKFFVYLLLLLAAILGQDVLLEPYAAEAFGWSVSQTTRLTSIWGGAVLFMIMITGFLEKRHGRKNVAQMGNLGAIGGFVLIIVGGALASSSLFLGGVVLLGAGTGISTVANLALMFDLTLPGQVGLFVGAWGLSNSFSRLTGSMLGGVVRDLATNILNNDLAGYLIVFVIETGMMIVAATMLKGIDVGEFRRNAEVPSPVERAGMID